MHTSLWQKLLFFPALAIGIVFLFAIVNAQQPLQQTQTSEPAPAVRTMPVPKVEVLPRALAYGTVQPAEVWEAVAQVSGTVIEMHPKLKKGALLPANTLLLKIDPTDYQLSIAQAEANLQTVQAELQQLEVEQQNTQQSLAIEQRSLNLGQQELNRLKKLGKNNAISQNSIDQQERSVLALRQSVQNLQNALNLVPSRSELLRAKLAANQAQLDRAQRDLNRTEIRLPFAARISNLSIEQAQFAKQGQILLIADGIDTVEITAQVALQHARRLILGQQQPGVGVVDLPKVFDVRALVRLRNPLNVVWDAYFVRASETLDPKTRTLGVVVAVDDSYQNTIPGIRPPLIKNMFVEVELHGKPRSDVLVVPQEALHDQYVYVLDADNRLHKRTVTVLFHQGTLVAIQEGLAEGEQIVISDVIPAIEGMLLSPQQDDARLLRLLAAARGDSKLD